MSSNIDAERTILGAVFVEPKDMALVCGTLAAEDFYDQKNRLVYSAMLELFNQDKLIDTITVKDELARRRDLERVGGAAYLGQLMDGVPRITNLDDWSKIIRKHATLRKLRAALTTISGACDEASEADEAVDVALNEIVKVAEHAQQGGGFQGPTSYIKRALATLERMCSSKGTVGVPSGLTVLDQLTQGFQAPQLIIIGARPGMGKSAAALTIADNAVMKGFKVGFVSLEMGVDEVGTRQIAKRTGWNVQRLKYRDTKLEDGTTKGWTEIARAQNAILSAPLFLDDAPYLTLTQIRARARRLKAEKGLDLLVIDYLQLVSGEQTRRFQSRQEEIAIIARGLKNLAKDLKVPIIALSQLNRNSENRKDPKPTLADLRESGELEQAADIVILLYRPHENDPSADPTLAEWNVAKHRNGRTGTLQVTWDADTTTFKNMVA